MTRFFISYSQKDASFADLLRRQILRVDNAHEVFIDRFGLAAGANIKASLAKRIAWCDFFILILSDSSLRSAWVTYEVDGIKKRELTSGEKKLFVLQPAELAMASLPKSLIDNLILDFSDKSDFAASFFRLMHAIYEKPTFYSIGYSVAHDPKEGYLVDLWLQCDMQYLSLVSSVEYRFDNEFGWDGYNTRYVIDGPVHLTHNRRGRFRIRELWTPTSIVVFVAVYLRTTKVVYLCVKVEVGAAVN